MSQQPYIIQVMESMGWNDGSFIPIANEENQILLNHVNVLTKARSDKQNIIQYYKTRFEKCEEHYDNAVSEFEQNLKLVHAYKSQLTSEHHLYKLSEQDDCKLRQQLKDIVKDKLELDRFDECARNEIEKITSNMEQLHEKIQWSKAALIEWRQVMDRGETTNSLIEKYCKIDATKAEALDSRRRSIQVSITKKRAILVSSYEEQKSLEQVLERTSQLYRQSHLERRQLVETWKEAINQMNQREKNINETEKELEQAKALSTQKHLHLKKHTVLLETQEMGIREAKLAINELNNTTSKLRAQYTGYNEAVLLKTSDLTAHRKTLQNIAEQLANCRNKNRRAKAEECEKEDQVQKGDAELERMAEKVKGYQVKNLTAHDRLKQLEEIMGSEERTIKALDDETVLLSGTLFRAQQQLIKLQDQEKVLTLEAYSLDLNIKKMQASAKTQQKELFRQTEMAYNVDYNIQQLEGRVAKMKGDNRNKDEQHYMEEKIERLEKALDEKRRRYSTLQFQVNQVEYNMRKLTNTYNADNLELERAEGKLKERKLYIEGADKQLAKVTTANHEKLVEQSLLQMRIKQLEKHIAKQDDKLYTLEKHKIELDTEMNARLLEIKAHLEMLSMRKKHLIEERAQLRADIVERNLKIDQLKKRYDVALELLGKNDDGTMVSGTQIKVQAAQEKFLLLKEGNDLNDKVLRAEEDVKAMENTLRLMNYSNESYRRSLGNVEENSEELKELQDLQNGYCAAVQKLKQARHSLTIKSQNLEVLGAQREAAEDLAEQMERMRLDSNEILTKVHKELLEQQTKMMRAERELKLVKKSARQKINDMEFMAAFELDLTVKEIEERNASGLQQLADLVEANDEMEAIVSKHLCEKGLTIPQYGRSRSQISWKSEASELSVRVSSKTSVKSNSEGSSPSQQSVVKKAPTAAISVVRLDFPGDDSRTASRKSVSRQSTGSISGKK